MRNAYDQVPRDLLRAMAAAIEHRGPDEGGEHLAAGVGLAIRRLRVIDLMTGSQPIANEDHTVWVVFNGEIYGYATLRDELARRGHVFRTQSDTECVVHAYEEFGDDCVRHLRGMFAFALWDAVRERLLLARDRLGKKPMVYAHVNGTLYFASEIQALTRVPGLVGELDLGALGDYLAYGYVPPPATIYRSVRKLPPGHVLTWSRGEAQLRRYWELKYQPKLALSEPEALAELERRLDEAVRLRLVADVPVGVLLSGGVDSGLVTAFAASALRQPVRTFSIGSDESAFDELRHARRIAERYATDHRELIVRPDAAVVLPLLVRHYGEPYADSSAIPTYYVTKLARAEVTVALNGDGGDEAFAGYDRVRAMTYAQAIHAIPGARPLARVAGAVLAATPDARVRRVGRFLHAAALPARERYAQWVSAIPRVLWHEIVRADVREAIERERRYAVERAFDAAGALSLVDRTLATDTLTYLPGDLLVKMDIASMANSLETRSPLLDHPLIEFAASLPAELKLRRGTRQKYLLKRLAERYLPRENIERPKQGFGVPVGSWLRDELREMLHGTLLATDARALPYIDADATRRLWSQHAARTHDRTIPLWTLLMLELWLREAETTHV